MAATIPYAQPLFEEVIPGSLRLKDKLGKASIGQARYNTLVTPVTGQSGYSAGGAGTKLMTFRLTSSDYADLTTLVLSFKAQADINNSDCAIDEHILSLVQQLTIRIGGVQLYTITDFPAVVNALVSLSMPKALYEMDGPAQGLYKSSARYGGDAAYAIGGAAGMGGGFYFDSPMKAAARTAAKGWLNTGKYYSVPLGWLFSGLSTYFPLRNVSNIEIELLLQSSVGSCVVSANANGVAAATVPGQINIQEAEMRVDMVRLSPDYYALMDHELREGDGAVFTVDCHANIPFSLSQGNAIATGDYNLQTAQAVRFLKTVHVISRLSAELNSANYAKSKFPNFQFARFQALVNGMSYPQIPLTKMNDAFNEMKKSMNRLAHVGGDVVAGTQEWTGPPAVQGLQIGSSRDGTWWGSEPNDDSRFVLTTNFEPFLSSNEAEVQGLNLAESAGSLVEIRLACSPAQVQYNAAGAVATATASAPQFNVILHHSGVLTIKHGAIEFVK